MRDAVTLTRKMGMRYLWIDAVCIVQPMPEEEETGMSSTSDWQREAPRMKYYYRNARCTIWRQHSLTWRVGRGGRIET